MDKVEARVGPWELHVRTHSGGGLYELEQSTTWTVVEATTGHAIRRYEGLYEASYDGSGWGEGSSTGVVEVVLHPDRATVRHADGRVEEDPLP